MDERCAVIGYRGRPTSYYCRLGCRGTGCRLGPTRRASRRLDLILLPFFCVCRVAENDGELP